MASDSEEHEVKKDFRGKRIDSFTLRCDDLGTVFREDTRTETPEDPPSTPVVSGDPANDFLNKVFFSH